jgi:hypothetical protein
LTVKVKKSIYCWRRLLAICGLWGLERSLSSMLTTMLTMIMIIIIIYIILILISP